MKGIRIRAKGNPIGMMILVIVVLSLKLLVPAGYMLQPQASGIAVSVCSDSTGIVKTIDIPVAHDGKNSTDRHQADAPCSYTALGMSALGATPPALLAAALLFILALGLRPAPEPPLRATAYLRPLLRGPPLFS